MGWELKFVDIKSKEKRRTNTVVSKINSTKVYNKLFPYVNYNISRVDNAEFSIIHLIIPCSLIPIGA